ncbi:MAG TPA: TIGR01777 family oxidoreductase [Bacteroidales bacterium]|nr:TIGR01777 family oxidoreductase [Bacteroidales bacterium]
MKEKVLISGGTGFIGKYLSAKLVNRGYEVSFLGRTSQKNSGILSYSWDIENDEIEKGAIETADYIIHLAGANIGEKRWTKKRKQLIIDSRVKTSRMILNKINKTNTKLNAFISASAIGYYGLKTTDKIYSETDTSSNDFLGEVCRKWEEAAENFARSGIRTVKIRTAVVLGKERGAFANILKPARSGFALVIGNGKQFMPWIHIDDLCDIYIKAIEDKCMNGPYNAVAPDHKTNKDIMKALAIALKKRLLFIKIPEFLFKTIFGEMSGILLNGSRVSSENIVNAGYRFKFADLESALEDILSEKIR